MIRVLLEVSSGGTRSMEEVRAEGIKQAIRLVIARHPGCEVRVLFPIDPEAFFVAEMGPPSGSMRPVMPEEAGRVGRRTAGSDTNGSIDGAAAESGGRG